MHLELEIDEDLKGNYSGEWFVTTAMSGGLMVGAALAAIVAAKAAPTLLLFVFDFRLNTLLKQDGLSSYHERTAFYANYA